MMVERSTDRVAIITGASRGIGAALVEAYSKIGYQVVANSRTIADSGRPEILTVAGDIADPETAERLVALAVSRFGRIDTLINNAGVFVAKPFTAYAPEDYALITSVNALGFFNITRRVISRMLKQGGGGHIINVTTTLAEQGHSAVPSALTALTKGGLVAVTKSLAVEYAGKGFGSTRYLPASSTRPCTPASMPTRSTPACIRKIASAASPTSSTVPSISRTPPSSPAKFSTSMAVKVQDIEPRRSHATAGRVTPRTRSS
jgi:NAD(P)-dependent dehydrogenase (short-subunit alcohol dehydrogenase family)